LDASGVRVASLLAAPDLSSPLLAVRQRERRQAERYLDVAVTLGAPAFRLTLGPAHPGVRFDDALALALEHLNGLTEAARQRGIVCGIENIVRDARQSAPDLGAATPDAWDTVMTRLADADPGLGILFNTANPVLVGADPLAALVAVPEDRLHAVHLSERDSPQAGGTHLPLGDGPAPWRRLRAALRGRGFVGPFTVVDGQTDGEPGTRRSLAWAKNWLAGWDEPFGY
jgi:sugar phosphate isomerase/epimerase